MAPRGRPILRFLGVAVAMVVWVGFVFVLLPLDADTSTVQLSVEQGPVEVVGPLGISSLSVQLMSLDVPRRSADSGELIFRSGAEQSTKQVSVGSNVAIGDEEFDVLAIRPWEGLLHRPPGTPMLNVAVELAEGVWIENLFVERDRWRVVTGDIAIVFGEVEPEGARWGVVEGERVHWFNSFVPGTGIELDDGTVVTLLARRPSGRILVEFARGNAKPNEWFDANAQNTGARVRYEDPSVARFRFEIFPNENSGFTVSLLEGDLELWTRSTSLGEILEEPASGLSFRIDQYEQDAFPLFASESPWLALVLSNEKRFLRIREGEAVRIGDDSVSFEAIAQPQDFHAEIAIAGALVAFDSDTVFETSSWRIKNVKPMGATEVTLDVDTTKRSAVFRVLLIVLFVAPAIWFLRRRKT